MKMENIINYLMNKITVSGTPESWVYIIGLYYLYHLIKPLCSYKKPESYFKDAISAVYQIPLNLFSHQILWSIRPAAIII